MMDGYEAMFQTRVPIARGSVEAHMETMDKMGNESLSVVYGTTLDGDVAAQVNWANGELGQQGGPRLGSDLERLLHEPRVPVACARLPASLIRVIGEAGGG